MKTAPRPPINPNPVTSLNSRSESHWPSIMIATLIVGYAGYYLCRSDLSVCRPLIIDEYKAQGITKTTIGSITGLATALYALGKFVFGSLADLFGGRRMFLLGMIGAVVCTILFGAGGPPLFLMAWCGNRFIQSSGWVGMIKITSRWFKHSVYGSVMGIISLSYLFGDFVSRLFLGALIKQHVSWQNVFFISAGILALICVPTYFLIKDSPVERGLPEPNANPESVFAAEEEAPQKKNLAALLGPLLKNRGFWTACVLSFGFTFMRETFNDWTPTFLHEVAKMSEGDAAQASSLFPLFGGFSVLGTGFLSDRLGRGGRAALIAIGLAFATVGLFTLAFADFHGNTAVYVAVTAAIAFVLIGPYSFLAGAISLDFGGKQASATAAGWIDGVGYIGGILSGALIAKIAESSGWSPAFQTLAGTALVSCLLAVAYWNYERKPLAA